MLEQARRDTHDTSCMSCRDVTQQVEFELYGKAAGFVGRYCGSRFKQIAISSQAEGRTPGEQVTMSVEHQPEV